MAEFLSRWDDESRPSFTDALKDLGLRAVLPAFVLFGVIVGFGFLLLGPWYQFADSENGVNRWFQDRRTETWNSVTHVMSTIGNTEYVIGVGVVVCAIIWWRTRRWWYAAVPMIVPGCVMALTVSSFRSPSRARSLARPKSRIFTRPSAQTKMLSGLTSR